MSEYLDVVLTLAVTLGVIASLVVIAAAVRERNERTRRDDRQEH